MPTKYSANRPMIRALPSSSRTSAFSSEVIQPPSNPGTRPDSQGMKRVGFFFQPVLIMLQHLSGPYQFFRMA